MKRFLVFVIALLLLIPVCEAQLIKQRSSSIVTIEGVRYYVHTVKKGETLYSLSKLYGVSEGSLKKNNPQIIDGLQEGQVLKIPAVDEKNSSRTQRQKSRLFDTHVVNQGETLYAISKRYEIPVKTLLEDNPGLDPSAMSVGQELQIRKKEVGSTTSDALNEEWNEYRDALNSVSHDFKYHLVQKGETLYSLSRAFGLSVDEIKVANDNLVEGLRAGAMIKIPVKTALVRVDTLDRNQEQVGPEASLSEAVDSVRVQHRDSMKRSVFSWFVNDLTVLDRSDRSQLNVAMLLPLRNESGTANRNYLEFYQGALLAFEELKAQGISAHLSLYNTARSSKEVYELVEAPDFANTDLIIGPVYEECFAPVLDFAENHRVAVVSPLATLEQENSPMLYQMAPNPQNKTDKLKEFFTEDKNVIYLLTTSRNAEFDEEVKPLLPANTRYVNYAKSLQAASIEPYISKEKENVFVISCTDEFTVDEILAKLSSMQNNLAARSIMNPDIRVIGSSHWSRFQSNIDKNLYFKLKLTFVTSYHADRSNPLVKEFNKRYIKAFGMIPSLYSYRGYDAVKLFVDATFDRNGGDFTDKVNQSDAVLLQMPYRFVRQGYGRSNVNDQWALVCYNNDYTIEVR